MTAATADIAAYLAAVRSSLSDLPEAERDDLVAEVEASLVESAGEGGSISARLGPPEEFAARRRDEREQAALQRLPDPLLRAGHEACRASERHAIRRAALVVTPPLPAKRR
ncbi:MAG TPA: hypothetical protein VJ645_02905 [Gaiellaceae bacterium]|nr:hypothetical protein [Gaiellaceae bacterium]